MSLSLAQVEHGPAQIFQTPFRARVERPSADLFQVATLVAPWGTERYSNRPYGSMGLAATYKPRIVGLTDAGPAVSQRVHSLAALETSIVVDDSDHYLRKLVHQYENRLPESPATLATAVRGLAPSLWWTYFTGALDKWELVPAGYRLTFRTGDRELRSPHPKRKIALADRPNAPAANVGRYYQIVYGVHDSAALESKGLVELILVDASANEWHLSLGIVGLVRNVYIDGTLVPVSNYTVAKPLTNGFRETVVKWTTTPPTIEQQVTCDVDGLTDRGTGGGRVFTRPLEITAHWLAQWVYGEPWTDGAWKPLSAAPTCLSAAWWTDQYLVREGHKATLVAGGETDTTDAMTVIEGIARTFHVHPYWNEAGRIAFRPIDPYVVELFLDRPRIRSRYDDIDAGFSLPQTTRQKVKRIKAQWLPSSADDRFFGSFEVEDLAVVEESEISIELDNSTAEA